MDPDSAARATGCRLRRKSESTALRPSPRRGIDENHVAVRLVDAIELSIRIADGPFAERIALAPLDVARAEVHAKPTDVVREPVHVVADVDHAAVLVLHSIVFVNLRGFVLRANLHEHTASAIAAGRKNVVGANDGCG